MKRPLVWIIGIAAVHFVVSFTLFMLAFSDSMARFDTGEPRNMIGSVIYYTSEFLAFPIVKLVERTGFPLHSTIVQYLPFLANSLLWGLFIVFVVQRLSRVA